MNAVRRMQEYIDLYITEPISLQDMARVAGYSPWHSARVFKDLTGKTPFDYIRSLRLSRAAERLKNGDFRVIDVAFDFVFGSHEGFTRAFSKQFGVSPKSYRKNTPTIELFMPKRLQDYYLALQQGDKNMTNKSKINTVFVQVVDRPARKLIIKRGSRANDYFGYCEELGCDVWTEMAAVKEALYEPMGMWLPDNLRRPDTSFYAMGVEVPVNFSGKIPEGCEVIDLLHCKMMVFQGQPFEDEKFLDAISDLWEVMKTYNPEIYGFQWADEDGPRFQLSPEGYRGYIEARPVRELNKKSIKKSAKTR